MANFTEQENNLIALCPLVETIAEPLMSHLSVNFFRYVRSYKDGTKFCVSTHEDWLRAYFQEKFYNDEFATYEKIPDDTKGIGIHGGCNDDNPVCRFWLSQAKNCNYRYVLAIYEKNEDYLDLFNFGVLGDNHQAYNIFLNNKFLFDHFIIYFYDEGEMIISEADENRFLVEPDPNYKIKDNWHVGLNPDEEKQIMKEMSVNRMYLTHKKERYLDPNEAKILKLLVRGYSEEQMAKRFKIPLNVVKNYLSQIHSKMGTRENIDLMRMFLKEPLSSRLSNFYVGKS